MANLTERLIVEVKVKVSATVLLAGWSFPTARVKTGGYICRPNIASIGATVFIQDCSAIRAKLQPQP